MLILDNRHQLKSTQILSILMILGLLVAATLHSQHINSEHFPNHQLFSLFIIFLCWLFSLIGYGQFILNRFRFETVDATTSMLVGTALYAILMAILGGIGGLNSGILIWIVVLIGIPLGVPFIFLSIRKSWGYLVTERSAMPVYLITSIYILVRFIQSLTPDMHPDALWYHLAAPLYWFEHSGFYFNTDAIQLVQASFWDLLNLWPMVLLGTKETGSLIQNHLFSQWITLFIGFAGTISILIKVFKIALPFKLENSWGGLIVLALATTSELSLSLPTPKNDWGVAFWFSGGLFFILNHSIKTGALFLGFATASKFSYAVPTLVFTLLFSRSLGSPSSIIAYIICLSFPIAIVFIRNFIWTGNPIFPLLNSIFSSSYLPLIWVEALSSFTKVGSSFTFQYLLNGFLSLFPLSQLSTYLLLVPSIWRKIAVNRIGLRLLLFIVVTYLMFMLVSGPRTELRLIGIIPLLVSGLSVYALWMVKPWYIIRAIPERFILIIFAIYLISFSETPWRHVYNQTMKNDLQQIITESSAGFIFENIELKDGEKLLLSYETSLYYFPTNKTVRIWDSINLSNDFINITNPKKLLEKLRERGFRYLLMTSKVIDNFYDQHALNGIILLAKEHPESIVARRGSDTIIDLNILSSVATFPVMD